jgi:hypothetical protein
LLQQRNSRWPDINLLVLPTSRHLVLRKLMEPNVSEHMKSLN